jgi:ADP-ribosylation factor GTPase-activating protein 2/3
LTLDSWTRKQITFMQLGGNAKAYEYFSGMGLIATKTAPLDYKHAFIQKYKAEQIKMVGGEGRVNLARRLSWSWL